MRRLEYIGWLAALALLSGMVMNEGRRRAELEREVQVGALELYRALAGSRTPPQVVDVRADSGFEDAHVPGAVPMPGCDLAAAPREARRHIHPSVPTVLVTSSGDPAEAARCAGVFTAPRTLAGGMEAWSRANLPEDSGEYWPPAARVGGGCL